MRLALVVLLLVPASAHAGKYMMGEPPSAGWDWVGRAVQAAVDLAKHRAFNCLLKDG